MSALSLSPSELASIVPARSARHVFGRLQRPWLWKEGAPALGRAHREALAARGGVALPTISRSVASADGSVKLALEYADGQRVEAVHMPRAIGSGRVTLCISSQ